MSGEGGDAVMNEKMEAAKKQCFPKDFRRIMRALQGLTEEDIQAPVPAMKERILKSTETSPLELFEAVFDEVNSGWRASPSCPVNVDRRHFVVPGVLIASLRNLGYEFGDRDVEEAMSRGGKLVLSDFTEEGMAMMADIHGRSGEKHEASSVRLSDVGNYLEDSRFHRP